MTRPFSVVIAALEVAFGISFLLSLGHWGEHRSILRSPDGTGAPLVRYLRGFSRCAPSGIRQSSRKLQIGPAVELAEPVEAELADAGRAQLSPRVADLSFNPIDEDSELPGIELALVGGAVEAAQELVPVEGLAGAVALEHREGIGDGAL